MKLWQKVFLLSLLFMTVAVEITAYLILRNNFDMSIERELTQAVFEHDTYSAGISGNVKLDKMRNNKIILTADELSALLMEMSPQNNIAGMAIYSSDENVIVSYSADIITQKTEFRSEIQSNDKCSTLIFDYEYKTYIAVGSKMELEKQSFSLFTMKDISILYENYDEQVHFVQIIGIVSSSVFAIILLIMVLILLSPLSTINRRIKQFSRGNYALRLKMKGGKEFKELAKNVNDMASAVEENTSRLQNLADSRKQFIDSLGHEMKTPLTSIIGFADLLRVKRRVDENERLEYSNAIVEEAKRLQGLSGKLLELAATSNLTIDFESLNVKELFEEVCTAFSVFVGRNINICFKVDNKIFIKADKELFKSLLYNLIDNAVKASPDGQEVQLDCKADSNGIVISVSDNGIGMDEDTVIKVTEPFYMADKSRSRKAGGVGLGLSLCIEIAKKHDAQIKIESKLGQGTTVLIIMPLEVMR